METFSATAEEVKARVIGVTSKKVEMPQQEHWQKGGQCSVSLS